MAADTFVTCADLEHEGSWNRAWCCDDCHRDNDRYLGFKRVLPDGRTALTCCSSWGYTYAQEKTNE